MYFNNAQCDVYIGWGAGKKLMSEMASARTSVRIVSPFLSEHLIGGLEELHESPWKETPIGNMKRWPQYCSSMSMWMALPVTGVNGCG